MADMTVEQALNDLEGAAKFLRNGYFVASATAQNIEKALATLRAELDGLRRDAAIGREIAAAFLPVMEAARPLVLNLERLRDAAKGASHEP